MARRLFLLIGALLLPHTTLGQTTYDGCTDFRGLPVASVLDNSIRDVAIAGYAPNGAPIIIRELVRAGLFVDGDIAAVQRCMANFGPGDWTHLTGPRRAINLRACLSRSQSAPTPGTTCLCFNQGYGTACR